MEELMTEKTEEKKIKALYADIIVERIDGKPYYSIRYFDIEHSQEYTGFSSYSLDYVFGWLDGNFEIVKDQIKADLINRKSLMENLNRFAPEHCNALINDLILKEPVAYDIAAVCKEISNPNN